MDGQEWQTDSMIVEMLGGRYDGLQMQIPDGQTEVTWEEPTWTGRCWSFVDAQMYRAPVTYLFKNGQPTGRRVVWYKYRTAMHPSESSI